MRRVHSQDQTMLKLLLYGQPGSTKTRTAATAALDDRTYPTLMVSAWGNPLSIRDYARQPDIVEIDSFAELNAVYSFLARGQPQQGAFWELLGRPKTPYKTLVLDGVTNLQRKAMSEAIGNAGKGPGDLPAPAQQQHHGQVLARMLAMADAFFQLPMHVIMTALEYEQVDAVQNIYYRVQLTGQAASELPAYAHAVGRLVHRARIDGKLARVMEGDLDNDVVSVVLWRPSSRWYSKWQYNQGVPYMVNPTIAEILDLASSS